MISPKNETLTGTQDDPTSWMKKLEKEAHVWILRPVDLAHSDWHGPALGLLGPDELERYQRFHFANDRVHYLAAHAMLRRVLSGYAGSDPADLRFTVNERGRPEIEAPASALNLRFNLTHTNGLCACVVTRNLPCGIDAEEMARPDKLKRIAERMFAPAELEHIGDMDGSDKTWRNRFFRHWTLREAYIKALGVGLSGSSRDFHFVDTLADSPRLMMNGDPAASAQWQLQLAQPGENYCLAVAIQRVEGKALNIVVRALKQGIRDNICEMRVDTLDT